MTIKKAAQKLVRLGHAIEYLKEGYRHLSELINVLTKWKFSRLLDPELADKEVEVASQAHEYNGLPISEYALKDHSHPEFLKKSDTVERARAIRLGGVDYTPEQLASADHKHPEYVEWDELVVEAEALNGIPADDFARRNHEHPEYLKKTDVVDAAIEIDGLTASDLAPFYHDHGSEYYRPDEDVHDTWELVDESGNKYTPSSFAWADHTHSEYLTQEEADEKFLLKDEPFLAARYVKAKIINVKPTTTVEDVGTTNFALLQMPHAIDQFYSEVQVSTTKTSETDTWIKVYGTELFTCPGRWFEYTLPDDATENIAAVIVQPETDDELPGLTHFVAWNGKRFRVYQYDYPGASTMKVKLLIFASTNSVPAPPSDYLPEPEEVPETTPPPTTGGGRDFTIAPISPVNTSISNLAPYSVTFEWRYNNASADEVTKAKLNFRPTDSTDPHWRTLEVSGTSATVTLYDHGTIEWYLEAWLNDGSFSQSGTVSFVVNEWSVLPDKPADGYTASSGQTITFEWGYYGFNESQVSSVEIVFFDEEGFLIGRLAPSTPQETSLTVPIMFPAGTYQWDIFVTLNDGRKTSTSSRRTLTIQ